MTKVTHQFDLPPHHKSIIKVIGVGGGGSNAVNHMYNLGIKDVEFAVCNTDNQALESSPVPRKLQIGVNLTDGLGAGGDPEKGREAALENKEEIRELLSQDTKMVFVTAGMGGGTGTGAAPIIAQLSKELDILTIGIVTAPFSFEFKRIEKANEGIRKLRKHCDTVLVIMNDKVNEIYGKYTVTEAFAQADNVLTMAAKGIAEIITIPGHVNVDFADIKTIMKDAGSAVMGTSRTSGENRARRAIEEALKSPLLNQQDIYGAKNILISITAGEKAELQMDEMNDIIYHIKEYAGDDIEVIFGHVTDNTLGEHIQITVIATGFTETEEAHESQKEDKMPLSNPEYPIDIPDDQKIKLEENTESNEGEESSLEFEWLKEEIKKEVEEEDKKEFEGQPLQFDFEPEQPTDKEDLNEEEVDVGDLFEELDRIPMSKREILAAQREDREKEFEGKKYEMSRDELEKRWEVPAYRRKNIQIKEKTPQSLENNISKFNLTEDRQILGDNKFLHDNVD